MCKFFHNGPFKIPVLNHDDCDGIYSLGVWYPDYVLQEDVRYFDEEEERPLGLVNYLVSAFHANKEYVINFLASFFSLHLENDKNLILTRVPALSAEADNSEHLFIRLIETIVSQSNMMDGCDLIQRVNRIREGEHDLDILNTSLKLTSSDDLKGKQVVLLHDFFVVGENNPLSVCREKLQSAGAEVSVICFARVADPVCPESYSYSRYLNYAYGLAIDAVAEAVNEASDFYRKERYLTAFSVLGFKLLDNENYLICDALMGDETKGGLKIRRDDHMKEIIELASHEVMHWGVMSEQNFPKALNYARLLDEYFSRHCHLLLGEHDFSFASALVERRAEHDRFFSQRLIATEYQAKEAVVALNRARGQLLRSRLRNLIDKGARIKFGVDARALEGDSHIPKRVPNIHFNFPHDGGSFSARTLPVLLENFFASARAVQEDGDKVFMALAQPKGKEGFYQGYYYGIFKAAAIAGYVLMKKRVFDDRRFPEYQHSMTKHSGSAPVAKEAREFVFQRTSLPYEDIIAHKRYGPSAVVRYYQESCPLLPDIKTDADSNGDTNSCCSFQRPN